MIARLKLVEPCHENRQVAADQVIDTRIVPIRQPNADLRSREYLTEAEVERLLKATRGNRWAHPDPTGRGKKSLAKHAWNARLVQARSNGPQTRFPGRL
jgi:hypothetical protein